MNEEHDLPEEIAAIKERGFVIWATADLAPELLQRFDDKKIPVVGVRHVRQWGIQVDDEREILGHERTSIPDEELWQIVLKATDGSSFEVNSKLVTPAPA